MNTIRNKKVVIIAALALLMAATRMHHFGSGLHLPDASLAIFLLAGVLVASPLLFGALMIEAAALDYTAVTQLGVDNYCITPAYWFLVPTYGVLWFAGRYYAKHHQNSLRGLGLFSIIAFAAVSLAFLISNGSFYAFSGRYPGMGLVEYSTQVAQYYVPYVSGAVVYLIPAVIVHALFGRRLAVQGAVVS